MTLDKYVYEIKQLLPDEGKYLDNRLIIHWINQSRAIWMKNKQNEAGSVGDDFAQTIYMDLNPADQSVIPDIPTKYRILKGSKKIPKLINFQNKDGIISVRNARVISERYNYVTREAAVYAGSGRINCKDIFVFTYEDDVYVKLLRANPRIQMLTHIIIEGFFFDPADVSEYDDEKGKPCYDIMKSDYPINDTLWAFIKTQLLESGMAVIKSNKYEAINNEQS